MNSNLQEDLQDVYAKTLQLAVGITQNKSYYFQSQLHPNDLKFIKKFEKEFTDFKKLSSRKQITSKSPSTPLDPLKPQISSTSPISPSKPEASSLNDLPRDSGKLKLIHSLQERKSYVSTSKAGKMIRYSGPGPNVLDKIKLNSSVNLEDSLRQSISERPNNLPHVSITTGKLKKPLELPSFKEYVQSERMKDFKAQATERLEKCGKHLEDFSKELSGLEIFVNSNPGVKWNSDKKVLLRLQAYPAQKALIIKAYNDQFESPGLRSPAKRKTFNENYKIKKTDKFLSKTPNPVRDDDFYFPEFKKRNLDPRDIVERCTKRFRKVRNLQNKKIIQIVDSLDSRREQVLRHKAQFILNDQEKFKDKSYSLRKMNDIKKKIDSLQEIRIKKSKKQAALYEFLMEFLKRKIGGPTEAEINFVEIVKNVLEEGWFLDRDIVRKIEENFNEFEAEEIKGLVEYLESKIDYFE
jgi:hypothetical protein